MIEIKYNRSRSYSCPDPIELQKIYSIKNNEKQKICSLKDDKYLRDLKSEISKISRKYLLNQMNEKAQLDEY